MLIDSLDGLEMLSVYPDFEDWVIPDDDPDLPWFEHHDNSRTALYQEIDSQRTLMYGHMWS